MEALTATIGLVHQILNKYESIQSLRDEIKYFRKVLSSVKAVLYDIRSIFENESNYHRNTSLKEPLQLINDAVKEGEQVLEACSNKKKLCAHIFSQSYLRKINTASAKIKDAILLLNTSGITMRQSIQEGVDDTLEKIVDLQQKIRDYHHDVADLFKQHSDEMQAGMDNLPEQIVSRLMQLGLGTSKSDIKEQLQEIDNKRNEFRCDKAFADEHLLEMVKNISLSMKAPYTKPPPSRLENDLLICPISLEVMKDPVLLSPSGQSYDKESICKSLLSQCDLCPATNKRYDNKLSFIDNIGLRQILIHFHGDAAYQHYDDSWFWPKYHTLWEEEKHRGIQRADHFHPVDSDNEALYNRVMVFLTGMNCEKINLNKAKLLVDAHPEDPVMLALKSFILHHHHQRMDREDIVVFTKQALNQGLEIVANSHNPTAQFCIGFLYHVGDGVLKDYAKAMEWYLKAANQGHASAQYNIGIMYYNGHGVSKDYAKAMEWYLKAANQGEANAQCNIGVMYKNGYGVLKDYAKAMEWYLKAANQGHASAQYNIGVMYYNGHGVSKDYAKAMEWYLKAANQGHASAQYNIRVHPPQIHR